MLPSISMENHPHKHAGRTRDHSNQADLTHTMKKISNTIPIKKLQDTTRMRLIYPFRRTIRHNFWQTQCRAIKNANNKIEKQSKKAPRCTWRIYTTPRPTVISVAASPCPRSVAASPFSRSVAASQRRTATGASQRRSVTASPCSVAASQRHRVTLLPQSRSVAASPSLRSVTASQRRSVTLLPQRRSVALLPQRRSVAASLARGPPFPLHCGIFIIGGAISKKII